MDFDRFFADSRYYELNNPPAGFSSATGAGNQNVEEETFGAYLEGNWATEVFGRALRLNGGVRYIETDQFISAPNNINGVRVVTEFDSTYERVPAVAERRVQHHGEHRDAPVGIAHPDPRQPERHASGHDVQRSVGAERHAGQPVPRALPR